MSEYVRPFVEEMEQRVGDLEAVHVWLTAYIVSLEQDLNEFMEALWMEEADPNQATWTPEQTELDMVNVDTAPDGSLRVADRPASMSESWARTEPEPKTIRDLNPDPPGDTAESVQADKDPVVAFVEVNEEQLDD